MEKQLFKIWQKSDNDPGAKEIDFSSIIIDKPTLIFFSGFSSFDKDIKSISSRFRILSNLTEIEGKNQQIFTASYRNMSTVFNAASYNLFPRFRFATKTSKRFSKEVMMPLLVKQDGAPLTKETAIQNMRFLTFGGYSIGTAVVQEIYNATYSNMKKMGYKKQDAKDILKEVVFLSVGTMSVPSREKNRFTTIYLVAKNDFLANAKNVAFEPFQYLINLLRRWRKSLRISKLGNHALIATARADRKMEELYVNKQGEEGMRRIKKLFPKWALVDSGHELPHYISEDDKQTAFAKMSKYIFMNALSRKEYLSPEQALLPPKEVQDIEYIKRLNKTNFGQKFNFK